MFNYFINNTDIDIQYGLIRYSKWAVIKKMYLQELAKVTTYYRNREYNLSNSNPLVRLVKTLARSVELPILEYLGYIDNDADYISKQFNFVSNINEGLVLDNLMFDGMSNEVFLCVNNTVDPFTLKNEWLEYSSIRVIKTDITNVYYPTLFRYNKTTPNISIFEIDIRGLLLQYYYWARDRIAEDRSTSINIFIPTIVLPNVSIGLVDFAIWNRFKLLSSGGTPSTDIQQHPMYLIDYTSSIDKVLNDVVKDTNNKSIYLTQLLRTIPTITNETMYNTLYIDKNYYNKQSKWVLWIARLEDIVTIHKHIGKRGYKLNRDRFNQLPYSVKLMERRETFYENKLDIYSNMLMKESINYIKKNIGIR